MPGLSAAKRRKLTRDESPSSEGPPRLSLSQLATRFAPSPALSQDVKPKVEGTEWPEVYVEVKPAFDEVKEDRPTYQPNTPAVKTEDSSTDTSVGGSPPTPVDVKPIIKSEGDVCSSAVGSDASINLFADKRAAALAIRERKKLEVVRLPSSLMDPRF